jgi:hypothetical protein
VTPARSLAWRIADALPGLDAAAMGAHPAFRSASAAALAVLDEGAVVERVAGMGGLAGARNPHAVIVSRLRAIPIHEQDRCGVDVERQAVAAIDSPRARQLRAAAVRGAVLRAHVERGVLEREEALCQLDWECRRDVDALDVALAAFDGVPVGVPVDLHRTDAAPAGVVR